MITIIIGDHFKKGMKSQGCAGLIPYNKKYNLLQQQCSVISGVFPKTDILYIYGFDAKRFNYFIEDNHIKNTTYILNKEYNDYSHGHSLYLAKNHIVNCDECLILLGYDPISVGDIKRTKKIKHSSALLDHKNKSRLGCIVDKKNGYISNIFFDLENYISNIYLLKKPEISILKEVLDSGDKVHNMFLFEIMNSIISHEGRLEALSIAN
jgi:choline kinase